MAKSIFSRFCLYCTILVLVSAAVVGLILASFFNSQYREGVLEMLAQNAKSGADVAAANYLENEGAYIDSNVLYSVFGPLAAAIGGDILLVEPGGRVVLCTEGAGCRHSSYLINQAVMQRALSSGYAERGTLGGMYTETIMAAGVVVEADGQIIAAVFSILPDADVMNLSSRVLNGLVAVLAIVIITALGFICVMMDGLTRPVRSMAQAAEAFARGDFTVRVPVEGYEETEKLALAFNNMTASLASLESSRRSMLANLSHEFKTPITSIGGFVDGILDGTIPPDKQSYYLEIVSREVKRLSRLIVSILNLARVEAGEMTFNRQPVDISELIRRTLFSFEMKIEEKQLEIRGIDMEKLLVEADPDMAHQVVYNILENAVKFTPKGGYIAVSHETEGGMVSVSIKNSGSGIGREEIPRLFDRFYKSDTSRGIDKSGVGLGLHIVKSTLHIMGGDIMVKSVEGEYADFIFSLALYKDKAAGSIFRKGEPPKEKSAQPHNLREEEI